MNSTFVIEPLGSSHDRAAFDCGVEPLSRYLRQQASQDMRRRIAAVFVLRAVDNTVVAGYYTLSATAIELAQLPAELTQRLPRYPTLPAVLLGRLAVDLRLRGQGLGELLLLSALRRSVQHSTEIAAMAVVVDAKDDAARRFYERYGFQRFHDQEFRLFLPMATIERLFV